jgi:Nickel responsive protein SCO4226-like
MPRYVVERTFADGLQIPADEQGAKACMAVVEVNAGEGVTWVHSYVTDDRARPSASTTAPTPRPSAGPPRPTSSP